MISVRSFIFLLLIIISVIPFAFGEESLFIEDLNSTEEIILKSDLAIGQISLPLKADMGFPIDGSVAIINSGPAASTDVSIDFSLIDNQNQSAPKIWVHQKTADQIPGLYLDIIPFSVTIPDGIKEGAYDLVISINGTGNEMNLTNNIGISSYPVEVKKSGRSGSGNESADLSVRIDNLSSLNITPGFPYMISYTVRNTGEGMAGTFYVGFFLSEDSDIEPSDIKIFDEIYYSAYPGMEEHGESTDLISDSLKEGTYYLGALIDFTSKIQDSDRENNMYLYPVQVNVTKPASVITDQVLNEIAGNIALKTNKYREYEGLPVLTYDRELGHIASLHSQDMAFSSFFSHINPDGLDPTARAVLAGYDTSKRLPDGTVRTGIAENILKISPGFTTGTGYSGFVDPTDPEGVADVMLIEWISSPEHRKNLMNPDISRIGVGVAYDGEFFYATQDFY